MCRIVNNTNEKVLNSTACPFSDWDDPPYTCVNGSKGHSRSDMGGRDWFRGMNMFGWGDDDSDYEEDEGDDDGWGWMDSFVNFFNPPRPTRKDHCKLNLVIITPNVFGREFTVMNFC